MRNRTLISFSLALAMLVVACDEPVGPGHTGSIVLQFVIPEPPAMAPADSSAVDDEASDPERSRERPDAQPGADSRDVRATETSRRSVEDEDATDARSTTTAVSGPNSDGPLRAAQPGTIEAARAIISGPTDTTVNLTVTATEISGTIEGLRPGTYSVTVEGLIGGAIDHYGQATGVTVQSEQTATATITFASFLPDLSGFGLTSTTAFAFNVTFPTVAGATNYDMMWDTDPGFGAGPDSSTAGAPSLTVTVGQATTHYVRARARNTSSSNVGRWSSSQSVNVIPAPSGTPAAPTPTLGDTLVPSAADTAVAIDVNVDIAGRQSWFTTPVCMGDTLTFRAVAANLSPPSPLDTYLRIVKALPATDTIATNNDANGTDAEIMMVVPETDSVRILVGGENNTVGHFELRVRRAAGLGRSPPGSCLGVVPDHLGFLATPSPTSGSVFTLEVEVQDQFGAVVPAASNAITLNMGINPGSVLLHLTDYETRYRYVDHKVPTIFSEFSSGATVGEMFAATYDSTNGRFLTVDDQQHFYSIDAVTGQTDTIAQSISPRLRGLGFVDNGTRLLGAERNSNTIDEVNPATGGLIPLGPVTGITASFGFNGMATDPTSGRVYAISNIGINPTRELISFDPATLVGAVIDTLDVDGLAGIAFATDGTLLGIGGDGSPTHPATLVVIDKATALVTDGLTGMGSGFTFSCCGETIAARPAFLSGTLTRNAVNGVATFDDLVIDATEAGYTVQASAVGLTGSETAPFNVNGGPVTNLVSRVDVTPLCCSQTMFPFGDTVQVTATYYDADQNVMSGISSVFQSFNPSRADIDGGGLITSNTTGTLGGVSFIVSDIDSLVGEFPFVNVVPMPVALVTPQTSELSAALDSLNANMTGFVFDTINIATVAPSVAQLQNYATVVLWMDFGVADPVTVGNNVEAYVQSGGNAVLPNFFPFLNWGALDALSPFPPAPGATLFTTDSLDTASMTAHPLTAGLSRVVLNRRMILSLAAGATSVATFTDGNQAIGYRVLAGGQRVVGVSFWMLETQNANPGPPPFPEGDYWRMMQNAIGWSGNGGTLFPTPPMAPAVAPPPGTIRGAQARAPDEIPVSARRPGSQP